MNRIEKIIVLFVLLLIATAVILNKCDKAEAVLSDDYTPVIMSSKWNSNQGKACTKIAWTVLREDFSEIASAAILGNMVCSGELEPFDTESIEATVSSLVSEFRFFYPDSAQRINAYELDEIAYAVEEFRLCYGLDMRSDYARAKILKCARTLYAGYCEDIENIQTVAQSDEDFDISDKVNILNKKLGLKHTWD